MASLLAEWKELPMVNGYDRYQNGIEPPQIKIVVARVSLGGMLLFAIKRRFYF